MGCKTHKEVADLLRISPTTLSKWKKLPGFWEEVYSEAKAIIGDAIPEILASMVREANRGNVSAAKLCLQTMGLLEERSGVKIDMGEPLVIVMNNSKSLPMPQPAIEMVDGEFSLVEVAEAA